MVLTRLILTIFCLSLFFYSGGPAYGQKWKEEFDDICAKVNVAHDLTVEELNDLIKRTEKLMEEIKNMDLKSKRLYLFRLKKCKDFFEYTLQWKKTKKGDNTTPQ